MAMSVLIIANFIPFYYECDFQHFTTEKLHETVRFCYNCCADIEHSFQTELNQIFKRIVHLINISRDLNFSS